MTYGLCLGIIALISVTTAQYILPLLRWIVSSNNLTFLVLLQLHLNSFIENIFHSILYFYLRRNSGDTLVSEPLLPSAPAPFLDPVNTVSHSANFIWSYCYPGQTTAPPLTLPVPGQFTDAAATGLGQLLLQLPRAHQVRLLSEYWTKTLLF